MEYLVSKSVRELDDRAGGVQRLTIAAMIDLSSTGDAANDMFVAIANIEGSSHDDTLIGDVAANVLTGGKGRDTLNGGKGKDVFAYRKPNESPVGAANSDQIVGFEPGTATTSVDKIDLSAIDANSTKGGNQGFAFRGTKPFNGPSQIRLLKSGANLVIQGNVNASLAADFEIVLKGMASKASLVTAKDFKL